MSAPFEANRLILDFKTNGPTHNGPKLNDSISSDLELSSSDEVAVNDFNDILLKRIQFADEPETVCYSVSTDVEPSDLKPPPLRCDHLLTPSIGRKHQAISLVDRGVECIASKLLDLSQCDPLENGDDSVERPFSSQTEDSGASGVSGA